jgi:hypothetical protein
MFQNAAKPVDGETGNAAYASSRVLERDSIRPQRQRRRRNSSFESELHEFEERAEQRFKLAKRQRSATSVRDEVQKLRDGNELLRKEMEALRGEFQALKDILLAKRG